MEGCLSKKKSSSFRGSQSVNLRFGSIDFKQSFPQTNSGLSVKKETFMKFGIDVRPFLKGKMKFSLMFLFIVYLLF